MATFFFFGLTWFIGTIAGFFLLQVLIVLFFAIPFTLKLMRAKAIKGSKVLGNYLISLLVIPGIFALITWAVYSWLPNYALAYWIGIAILVASGIGKYGENQANVADYMKTNWREVDVTALHKVD
ncbi:hypothetical protein LOC68_26760 [Blastopirellula sp. JC732]|uniref:Uncharacterized protein n=1 Tax=Blastopirellula sediminis TaxID=2894196 RepID=A0A9X1MR54_9BACT|nr:hypothetical protein [Blastopirellula sediminis]MCC9604688.1 hypothetical protein [Blastopirellula sediminis]MCC9632013.1 hypothetical protein [Blastopirellula sediminis]